MALGERILWSRSPGILLQPDSDCKGIPLKESPESYTSTMFLMRGKQGGNELNWIQKYWPLTEGTSFTRELAFYTNVLLGDAPPCTPTLIQAWTTEEGHYLAIETPHHVGWLAASSSLSTEIRDKVIDAYHWLSKYGVLHGSTDLTDILIGDDRKVTLVNFLNAAAVGLGYEEAGIPSCDIEAFELERRRVIARLEAGSSLPASESGPEPFKIPSQMRVCSSANASKQTFERETDLELEPVERSKFETCLFYGGRQRSPSPPSKPSLPRAPALYTSALGIIERDLSKEKRRVRFDYGTMDSHLWSSAEEYFNTPLLRVARQSEKREQEQTRRREEHASKHWQQKAADSRHRPTVLPCPPTLPTSLPDQALLCAPQSQNRRHAPLGVLSGSPPPSLTYEEPSPAHGYATTEAEGEDNSQETMTIVITSPTGQQHVWGAPSRLVNKISKYLSKLGARQSTGVPDATPTAQKRNAEDEGMDESDPKPCISSQLEVKRRTKSPGLHEMEEVRRQLNLEDPKQEAEAETKAGVKASSQAGPSEDKALTTLGGGPGRPQASPLKRKVDVDELSDDRKVRSKESWLPGNSLPGL